MIMLVLRMTNQTNIHGQFLLVIPTGYCVPWVKQDIVKLTWPNVYDPIHGCYLLHYLLLKKDFFQA